MSARYAAAACLLALLCLAPALGHAQDEPPVEPPEEPEESPWSLSVITHARTYSLFGASLGRIEGQEDFEVQDLAVVVERVRPTLELWYSDWLGFEAAWDVLPIIGGGVGGGGPNASGFAIQSLNALRLVDFEPALYTPDSGAWVLRHNLDRLVLKLGRPGMEVALGRQAFNHGSARMFPATDLFAPFGPGTIDTEFKRGVDGARGTLAIGENHELEVYAIAHEPSLDDGLEPERWMYLGRWRGVFPELFDVSIFGGFSYAQPTFGLDISGSVLGAAVYAEGSARVALEDDQNTTVRATAGLDYKWPFGLQTLVEVHYNGAGLPAPYPDSIFTAPTLERQTGEVNYLGTWYVGVSGSYTWDLLGAGIGYIQNLEDGSLLLTGNLAYDFAENVAVGLGGLVPLGRRALARPTLLQVELRSEFGLFPILAFADVRLTF